MNRESGEVEPLDVGGPILAQCWPRGSTSDPPQYLQIDRALPLGAARDRAVGAMVPMSAMAAPRLAEVTAAAKKVEQEQLGDLKLYRVPDRTTVASRQSKQVRLLDRSGIPITRVYGADLAADENVTSAPAHLLLRTINDVTNHLGLPLPSGRVAVLPRGWRDIAEHESNLRDLAVDEEVEIDMGDSPDVQVTAAKEKTTIDPARTRELPWCPASASAVRASRGGQSCRHQATRAERKFTSNYACSCRRAAASSAPTILGYQKRPADFPADDSRQ